MQYQPLRDGLRKAATMNMSKAMANINRANCSLFLLIFRISFTLLLMS
jgi:hypothetical protein